MCKHVISFFLRTNSQSYSRLHNTTPVWFSISVLFFSSSQTTRPKSKNPIAVSEYLINQHHFSPEAALKASSTLNYLKKPQCSDLVLSFLKETGFSQSQLEDIIKKLPKLLSSDLDKSIKPKIKIFQDLGFSHSDIADIISTDPWILLRSLDNRLGPSILVLRNVLGSNDAVYEVLKSSGTGRFLKHDLEKSLVPNIEFLRSCGISRSVIFKYLTTFPRLFVLKPESIVDLGAF